MAVIVKICGITNLPDALAAAEAGADALGFVFYERSPRYVAPEAAAAIIRELPPLLVKVGVFVDADEQSVLHTIRECGLNVVQLHGDESPEYCRSFGIMTIKAFRVAGPETIEACAAYSTDALLLDAVHSRPARRHGSDLQLGPRLGSQKDWPARISCRRLDSRECG